MAGFRQFVLRLASLFRGTTEEREMSREIDAHLALLEDEFVARGMSPADAKLAAKRSFGGVEQVKEHHRDARSFRWIADLRGDVAYALRSLKRTPAFTLAAIVTLAVGIGATTAIYSVVDRVLLRPLPFLDADRLVYIREPQRPNTMPGFNHQEYLEWRAKMTTLLGVAVSGVDPMSLIRTREGTVRLSNGYVSTNYFEVLGISARFGRTIRSSDDANLDVAVLSYEAWQRHFHGDQTVVGSTIEVRPSNRLLTVVGIMPEGTEQLGMPIDIYSTLTPGSRMGLSMFGRLKEGVSPAAAEEEANNVGAAIRPPRPDSAPPLTRARFQAEPIKDNLVAALSPALRVFLAAVAVVLLIVCANLANLLLARGTSRQREIAVRLAIGASRARIIRQVMTECVVLALIGGSLGALVGAGGVALVKQLAQVPADGVFRLVFRGTLLPRAGEVNVDLGVLFTALGLALATSLIFGLLPAVHLSRTSHLQAMGTRGGGSSRRETRVRTALVIGQLTLATILLVGAGLLMHSFINLSQVEKGYDPSHALAFQLVLPAEYSTARKAETIEALLAQLRQTPGVEAAGFSYAGILIGVEDIMGNWAPPGRSLEDVKKDLPIPRLKTVSPGYFEATRMHIVDGRAFEARDSGGAPLVAVINKSVARRFFGNVSPVGATLAWHWVTNNQGPTAVQIIGVVEDVRQGAVEKAPYSEIFMDYRQVLTAQQQRGVNTGGVEHIAFGFMSFAIRTAGDPAEAIPMVRRTVYGLDRNAGIDAIIPMEQLVSNSVARQRFYAVMLGIFAAVAGLLAAVGIYGVLAYAVVQRTQEIGVRLALGADRLQVLSLILRRGLLLTAVGIAVGLAGAIAGARYLQSMLFGIEPRDPATFLAVATGFAVVALLASYLPARRATKVDPMEALRTE
jgi:putative ABC transport system permease protein